MAATSILAAIAACTVEPAGPPSITTKFESAFALTADRPVAIRTLKFSAIPGELDVGLVEGYLEVVGAGGGGPTGASYPDVWISILNPETSESSEREWGIGHASVDGWGHGVPCDGRPAIEGGDAVRNQDRTCHAKWMVVTRWRDPQPGREIALELNANLRATASRVPPSDQAFSLAEFSVVQVDEPTFESAPATSVARLTGASRVTPTSGKETRELVLRVPAALLESESGFPVLGRLFVGSTVTNWSGPPVSLRVTASVGDRSTSPYGSTAGELDWLALCELGVDCELRILLAIDYWSTSEVATLPPTGEMAIDWVVEARLEDFSARGVLPASIELAER